MIVADREMLVVLDNCEHVIGACARLAESLLSTCPNLAILSTSREPLHIAGEVDWRVPSLSPPEARKLFLERAAHCSHPPADAHGDDRLEPRAVRHYARERLVQAGEQQRLRARHRRYYLSLSEELEPATDAQESRRRLAREADEPRLALRTALRSEPELALRLAAALWRFWDERGDRTEGARWLEEALSAVPAPSPFRAQALHGLSVLSVRTSGHQRALSTATEAVSFYRESGNWRALSEELHHLGTMAWVFSDFDGAERWCEESGRIAEEANERAVVASVLHTLGVIAASRNDAKAGLDLIARGIDLLRALPADGEPLLLPVALGYGRVTEAPHHPHRRFLEQTFVTARRVRPAGAVAYALCDLAAAARDVNDRAASRTLLEESLSRFRELRDELGAAQALAQLGNLVSADGEHELARELHEESLVLRQAANDARGIGLSLMAIAVAAIRIQELERAQKSAERALALFERTDDGPGRASAVVLLGFAAADGGRLQEAWELQQRALELWRNFVPNSGWCTGILLELAELDAALACPERAPARVREALQIFAHIGDQEGVSHCESRLSAIANAALTAD